MTNINFVTNRPIRYMNDLAIVEEPKKNRNIQPEEKEVNNYEFKSRADAKPLSGIPWNKSKHTNKNRNFYCTQGP